MPFQPGHRRVGGRAKGTPNKASAARQAEIAASGQTPLDYMLGIMRDPNQPNERRDWAAEKSAPYVHPRLAASTIEQDGQIDVRAWLQSLGEPEAAADAG